MPSGLILVESFEVLTRKVACFWLKTNSKGLVNISLGFHEYRFC